MKKEVKRRKERAIAQDKTKVWITITHKHIPYEKLSRGHLSNIARMLLREGNEDIYPNLMEEYKRRGYGQSG